VSSLLSQIPELPIDGWQIVVVVVCLLLFHGTTARERSEILQAISELVHGPRRRK
jgi:hypothetical protein